MPSFKIKSIVYEAVNENGEIEEFEIVDEGNLIFLTGADHSKKTWFATELPEIKNSTHAVIGCKTIDDYFEEGKTRDMKNTMIGMVKGGNHDLVICTYSVPEFGMIKS